jgi:5-methylcytosine-specific restriction protein B
LVIDEINRGNIAKIFGELMFLLEYRDRHVELPYSGEGFSIPDNVYIIGTMNTADRSIALVDFALRRRFHFVHFGADRGILERWIRANGAPVPYALALFDAVNRAIDDRDYQIGFSHFMKPGLSEADLRRVWRYSVEPYLEEYFFDNRAKVEELRWETLVSRLQGEE